MKRSIRLFARTLRSAFVPQVCAVLLLSTSPFLLAQAQGGATTAPAQGTGEAAPAMQVRDLRQLAPTNQVPGQPATGDQGNSEYVYGRTMPVMTPALTHPQTEFQQMVFSSTGRKLPIFGADLFGDVPSTFAPVDNIPVTPDYVIGPGDELRLQIWGQVNQNGSYIVDRTGLNGFYDVSLSWDIEQALIQANKNPDTYTATFNAVQPRLVDQALLDQLGLKLVPTNMPVDFVVVDKAKSPGAFKGRTSVASHRS